MTLAAAAAYAEGDAFQAEKRTVFASEWLPAAMSGQIPEVGDFTANSIGGWPVFAVRGQDGAVRAFRNVCRHQNMQVVEKPGGRCTELRCRYHGWTYDLAGRFVTAPPAVAPADPDSAQHHLQALPTAAVRGVVLFSLAPTAQAPATLGDVGDLIARHFGDVQARYAGNATSEVGCNWKTYVEHALAATDPPAAWTWPLLLARPHGAGVVIEQVIPRTFLRSRVVRHLLLPAGDPDASATRLQGEAEATKAACEALQAQRAGGTFAPAQGRIAEMHERLAAAYAADPGA